MEKILRKVNRRLIKSELTEDKILCYTNYGGNIVFSVDYYNAPNTLLELGRLREIAFRDAGGGTGKSVDIDKYDISKPPFQQLIVWDPKDKEIISSYRYLFGKDIRIEKDIAYSPTADLFEFSEEFIKDYLPYSIELGRSFVQPQYQAARSRKGLFALDNVWDGLGSILYHHPEIKYVFGKMTMYKNYDKLGRDLILYFLNKHFSKGKPIMKAYKPLGYHHDESVIAPLLPHNDFKEDYKALVHEIDKTGSKIPPLINIYMRVASTMQCFGTSDNEEFGDTEETVILVKIDDIYPDKKERHLNPKLSKNLNDYKNGIFRKK